MKIDVTFSEKDCKFTPEFGESIQIDTAGVLEYVTQVNRLFYKAEFPAGYELEVNMPNCPDNISEMFRIASELKKLTLIVPTNKAYNASYFVYDTVSEYSTLEELNLPSGIKFSNFSNFATRNKHLKAVNGAIDLSESTSNESCFTYCLELVDVSFVFGTITKSISFAQSTKLSRASIESILAGLYEVGDGQTLTLSESAVDKAYAWDIGMGEEPGTTSPLWQEAVIHYTEKGWTITLL